MSSIRDQSLTGVKWSTLEESCQTLKLSIIIPVYQVAPYIEDCLRSVMRQTYQGAMECLIVDDCGTDDSIAIAERAIASYDGPIVFHILYPLPLSSSADPRGLRILPSLFPAYEYSRKKSP